MAAECLLTIAKIMITTSNSAAAFDRDLHPQIR